MNYIVFDLEWNQAADLKTRRENRLLFEIIEIGAIKLNEKKELLGDFHELIKPQVFHAMNQVTGELIHLKIEQLENCRSFAEVAADFLAWCGSDYIFCTWGNLDLTELQKNMDYYNMTPVSEKTIRFYDMQKLFSIAFEDRTVRRTLQYAVEYLGIEKDVAFHRAYTDAYYTAEVVKRITDHRVLRTIRLTPTAFREINPRRLRSSLRTISNTFQENFQISWRRWLTGMSFLRSVISAVRGQGGKFRGLRQMENIIIR